NAGRSSGLLPIAGEDDVTAVWGEGEVLDRLVETLLLQTLRWFGLTLLKRKESTALPRFVAHEDTAAGDRRVDRMSRLDIRPISAPPQDFLDLPLLGVGHVDQGDRIGRNGA